MLNGNVTKGNEPQLSTQHDLKGGSVKNKSKFANGDMDRESFLALFTLDQSLSFHRLEFEISEMPLQFL